MNVIAKLNQRYVCMCVEHVRHEYVCCNDKERRCRVPEELVNTRRAQLLAHLGLGMGLRTKQYHHYGD